MSTGGTWVVVPSADFSEKENWKSLGSSRYSAFRAILYVKASNGDGWRHGPIVAAHNINPNDTITVEHRRQRIWKRTDSASETLNESVSTRFLNAWSSKLAAEAKSTVAGQSAAISNELTSTFEHEFSATVGRALTNASSFEMQDLIEAKHQIELKGSDVPREAHFRHRFWPRHWDVYLFSVEYLELSFRRRWVWWQVRDTIKEVGRRHLGIPLFRVTFYDPQENIDITYGPIQNELSEPHRMMVEPLSSSVTISGDPPFDSLAENARRAFPQDAAERKEAESHRGRKKRAHVAKKAKKAAARRHRVGAKTTRSRAAASRRAGAKWSAAKSRHRQRAAQRGAKRAGAKRAGAKRAAAKRGRRR
jgi:hypothetical protein